MESSNERFSKKLIHAKANMPNVQSLLEFGKLLEGKRRSDFERKYGKILHLMEVNVQVDAITALSQFYDPPYRAFTFQDFQMAPTIEEYEQILGLPLGNTKPYHYIGHYPSPSTVASLLKVKEDEDQFKTIMKNPNCVTGVPLTYLKKKLESFHVEKDWAAFTDVLSLAIFGIVLFPHIDEYVDFAAIDVFLQLRNEGHNPVPAVLADTYYSLNSCHEKKKKRILCCLPALYVWLTTHMFHKGSSLSCPIIDFKWCYVKEKSKHDWAECLRSLNEKTLCWYPKWQEVNMVIYQCGDFPNVPLLGTKGCINYNPSLALRQLCYPIMHPPNEELIVPFIVHGMDSKDTKEHRRVKVAWNKIVRKGKELGQRCTDAHTSYRQWVKSRVCEIKLPFQGTAPKEQETFEPTPITKEEVDELRAALSKSEKEIQVLQERLEKAAQENKDLQFENTRKDRFLERSNKRVKIEKEGKEKVHDCLRGANEELGVRNKQIGMVRKRGDMWKGYWKESRTSERIAQKELKDLKQQLKEMEVEHENRVRSEREQKEKVEEKLLKYQDELEKAFKDLSELNNHIEYQDKAYDDMKSKSMYWENRFATLLNQLENNEIFKELRIEGMYWRDCFSKLVKLANDAIKGIPNKLKEADATMHPLNTPTNVYLFVDYCKQLIEDLREKAGCPIRKRNGGF